MKKEFCITNFMTIQKEILFRNFVRRFGHLFCSFWAGGFAALFWTTFSQDLWTINAKSFWE